MDKVELLNKNNSSFFALNKWFSHVDIWFSREEFFGNNIHPKVIYSYGVIELLKSKHIEIKKVHLSQSPNNTTPPRI